jgi:transcriptional regulator with XRE-family HTH domain
MSKAVRRESLSHYVQRIMKEKNLSRSDVKLRSGGEITDSYVSAITTGAATNPSVEKLKALALGLRVSERELIDVAFGYSEELAGQRPIDQTHNLVLLDIRRKMVISSDVAEIAGELVKLPPSDRAIVFKYVKRLSSKRKLQSRRKLV